MAVRVQAGDFDPGAEIEKLVSADAGVGAVTSFVGVCRDRSGGRTVTAMVLEHYPAMTVRLLEEIEREARRRWEIGDCIIIHRFGRLVPGDRIVFVGVTGAHRGQTFAACEFLVDWLKTKAPFWKCEETPEGAFWVEAKPEDDQAAARWD